MLWMGKQCLSIAIDGNIKVAAGFQRVSLGGQGPWIIGQRCKHLVKHNQGGIQVACLNRTHRMQ